MHGNQRTVLIGIYIPPSEKDLSTVKFLDKALHQVDFKNVMILGDLNVNLLYPRDDRDSEIVDALQTFDLKNLAKSFKPRKRKNFNWTWRVWREGKWLQSICDYILHGMGTKWISFNMIDVMFNSDHRLFKCKLVSRDDTTYKAYCIHHYVENNW